MAKEKIKICPASTSDELAKRINSGIQITVAGLFFVGFAIYKLHDWSLEDALGMGDLYAAIYFGYVLIGIAGFILAAIYYERPLVEILIYNNKKKGNTFLPPFISNKYEVIND